MDDGGHCKGKAFLLLEIYQTGHEVHLIFYVMAMYTAFPGNKAVTAWIQTATSISWRPIHTPICLCEAHRDNLTNRATLNRKLLTMNQESWPPVTGVLGNITHSSALPFVLSQQIQFLTKLQWSQEVKGNAVNTSCNKYANMYRTLLQRD